MRRAVIAWCIFFGFDLVYVTLVWWIGVPWPVVLGLFGLWDAMLVTIVPKLIEGHTMGGTDA